MSKEEKRTMTFNPRTIQHGKESESWDCRKCNFSGVSEKNEALQKAKIHSQDTGHTVDVYYETWREVTCYKKHQNRLTPP